MTHPRRRGALTTAALAAALLVACVPYSGGARPFNPARIDREAGWLAAAPTPEVRQRGLVDCGPAALAMVVGRWHVALTLDEAIAEVRPRPRGTQLGDLRAAARRRGLAAFAIVGDEPTLAHELGAGRPILVGLLRPYGKQQLSHYEVVVALRATGHDVVTIDPGAGWRVRSWAAFDAEWRPAGRPALVVIGTAITPS